MYQAVHPLLRAGLAAQQAGQWAEAEAHYRAAATEAGLESRFLLGWLSYAQQAADPGAARAHIEAVLAEAPDFAPAWLLLGNLELREQRPAAALRHFAQVLRLAPGEALVQVSIGQALMRLGQVQAAREAYAAYLRAFPGDAEGWSLLARACYELDLICQEALCLERALALRPDDPGLQERRLLAWIYLGQREAVQAHFEQRLELSAAGARWFAAQPPEVQAQLRARRELMRYQHLLILYGDPNVSDAQLLASAAALPAPAGEPMPPAPAYDPGRPLRLGYLSRELGSFSSASAIWPLLINHGPAVELYAYSDAPPQRQPAATALFRERFAHWREVYALDNRALAGQIRADGIDVLIDMGGLTNAERNGVYAYKPAPVQLGGLGFGFSACHRAIEYLLGDAEICPPEIAERVPETVLQLVTSFHWHPPSAYETGAPPCLQQGLITFGSANTLNKLNPRVLALWARILHELPSSQLYLKTPVLGDEYARAYWYALFAAYGIGRERLRFAGQLAQNHLQAFYPAIDIALDPFPYQGGVTSCEALWMGVPVVSLRHPDWRARAGTPRILAQIGHRDWICHSEAEYLQRALSWAADVNFLRAQRESLRQDLLNSPICDGPAAAAELEALCLALRQQAGTRRTDGD